MKDVEQRLSTALEHAAPNDPAGVLSRCGAQKGTVIAMTQPKKRRRWASLAVAACLVLAVAGGGVWYQQANTVASVVSLDVNPSIQLNVNKNEKVLSAVPMNDDAAEILNGMELKGTQADVAMSAIIGSLLQHGYVSELANSILITVEDDDAQRGEKLQQELTQMADAALASAQVNASILSQVLSRSPELTQKAQEYGISEGKAALIQAVVEGSNGTKTFEQLVGLSINDLNLLYAAQKPLGTNSGEGQGTQAGGDQTASGGAGAPITASGQASQSAYIGMEAAKEAALSHAGYTQNNVTFLSAEYDYDDGRMIYEVEFRVQGAEYEYEIDAATGQVIKYEQEGEKSYTGSADTSSYIGEDAAKAAALSHAGVSEGDTSYCNAWLEWDDGRPECYEVEFMAGSTRYEYEIALTSPTVWKAEKKNLGSSGGSASNAGSSGGSSGAASGSDVGESGAKAAAFAHAGVSEGDVSGLTVKRDYDDGRLEYEIEFWVGQTEYDYTISGSSGTVLDSDTEYHGGASAGGGSASDIGESAARSAAFAHAGVSESQVSQLKTDRDYDDGRLEYEVEFKAGGMEYEYVIDGSSGTVLSWESGRD